MGYLWIDGWVVTSPTKVETVALSLGIGKEHFIRELARDEKREPLAVDNMLVSSNRQLSSTIEEPLVFLIHSSVIF